MRPGVLPRYISVRGKRYIRGDLQTSRAMIDTISQRDLLGQSMILLSFSNLPGFIHVGKIMGCTQYAGRISQPLSRDVLMSTAEEHLSFRRWDLDILSNQG